MQSDLILKDSTGKEHGQANFDLAKYAKDLETLKIGEKLKQPIKLQFVGCEDPKAFIDVVVIYQKREEKQSSSRQTTAQKLEEKNLQLKKQNYQNKKAELESQISKQQEQIVTL